MSRTTVLVGLHAYADPSSWSRQQRAVEALASLDDVETVNLQFADRAPLPIAGVRTWPVLQGDSTRATGAPGRPKPLAREVFDVLASRALADGMEYFAFVNSDILVMPSAIEIVRGQRRDAYVFSRGDVDVASASAPSLASSASLALQSTMLTAGQDLFVVSVSWWRRHARRFRPYILGEGCWDNVYTARLMCHSNGLLFNREPHIVHERHPAVWHAVTPAARYNGMLAALDARYFSRWCGYWSQLEDARRRGASADEEQWLRETQLTWRRSGAAAALQIARSVRARVRYRQLRRAWLETRSSSV